MTEGGDDLRGQTPRCGEAAAKEASGDRRSPPRSPSKPPLRSAPRD